MRRNGLFWGVILILIGALFLLQNMGLLPVSAGQLIGPVILVAIGASILWGAFFVRRNQEQNVQMVNIPLEGASRARVRVRHGAGRLEIRSGANAGEVLSGTFGGGLDYRARREGDALDVKLRVPEHGWPNAWMWGSASALNWSFGLNGTIPISLDLKVGANEALLDLTDTRVTDLRLETGASSTALTMPAQAGYTRADIHAGVASVRVTVPQGVAARIRVRGGLSGISVNAARFPRQGDHYQSTDYDTAANKVELDVETGVGSVDVG